MEKNIKVQAADALLDNRLKINIPAPWLLRVLGVRSIPIYPRLPVGQTVIRMSRLFVRMNIDLEQFKSGKFGTLLEFVGRHGVSVSRIIAYGLIRGTFASWLLNRPVAWYIRSHMTVERMAELARILALVSGAENFVSTITSIAQVNVMAETVSHKENGS